VCQDIIELPAGALVVAVVCVVQSDAIYTCRWDKVSAEKKKCVIDLLGYLKILSSNAYIISSDGRIIVNYDWNGCGISRGIRRCFLAVEVWVEAQVSSFDVHGGRSETNLVSSEFLRFSPPTAPDLGNTTL
jgi:hypothetical protein